VRELSNWGLKAQIAVDTACFAGFIGFGAQAFGGDENYTYRWNSNEWEGEGPHALLANTDTTLQVIVTDGIGTATDTADVLIDFLDDTSTDPCRPFRVVREERPDPFGGYIGGYEVLIKDYSLLVSADDAIYQAIPYEFQVEKITDRSPEIFAWLEMLDINVVIIIVLMVVISIVNMTSALLIIILERQQMSGTLKALGMANSPLIRVFLVNAAAIVGKGMLIGNAIGIGFALLQAYTHFIPLDATNYYVNHVPIALDWISFLILDASTLLVCVITLVVPALYITTIYPIRSIRFS
jgi:ABC-type antimicrobial peptide transport system permease subunit